MFDLDTLKAFEDEVRKVVPGLQIGFKDSTRSQKLLGFLMYPFNPQYMTRYMTTFYPTVYFPSKAYYAQQPKTSFTVLAHEMVHLVDTAKQPIWFRLSYALPQLLALVPLLVYGVLAGAHAWVLGVMLGAYLLGCLLARKSIGLFWCLLLAGIIATGVLAVLLTHWLSVALFLGLACLAPWPSPWRTKWEMRGYTMNLAIMQWSFGSVPEILKQSLLTNFVTGAYYFMSWEPQSVMSQMNAATSRAQSGELQKEFPYSVTYDFMSSIGLVKK